MGLQHPLQELPGTDQIHHHTQPSIPGIPVGAPAARFPASSSILDTLQLSTCFQPDFPADSSWTPMQTTSVCINGRNGSDKWRQQVWFCNCLRSFGAEGGFGGHHNLHPRGRAGGGSGGHHHPHPHRKAGSRDKRGRSSSRQAPTSCSGCVAGAGRFPNKE